MIHVQLGLHSDRILFFFYFKTKTVNPIKDQVVLIAWNCVVMALAFLLNSLDQMVLPGNKDNLIFNGIDCFGFEIEKK